MCDYCSLGSMLSNIHTPMNEILYEICSQQSPTYYAFLRVEVGQDHFDHYFIPLNIIGQYLPI